MRHLQAWHHGCDAFGIVLRAVRQQGTIAAQQFLHGVGFAAEQRFGESDVDINFHDHVAELAFPDRIEHRVACMAGLIVALQGKQCRQPELGLIVDFDLARSKGLGQARQASIKVRTDDLQELAQDP